MEYLVPLKTVKICLNNWCHQGKPIYNLRNKDTEAGRSKSGLSQQTSSNMLSDKSESVFI